MKYLSLLIIVLLSGCDDPYGESRHQSLICNDKVVVKDAFMVFSPYKRPGYEIHKNYYGDESMYVPNPGEMCHITNQH